MCDFREAAENVRREIQERGAVENRLRQTIQQELQNVRHVRPGTNVHMTWDRFGNCLASLDTPNKALSVFGISSLDGMFYNAKRKFAYYEQGVLDDMFKLRDHAARYIAMRVGEAANEKSEDMLRGEPQIIPFDVRWTAGVCHATATTNANMHFPVHSLDGLFDDIHFELNVER